MTTGVKPELSVIVCAHNEAEYIGACLDALLHAALRDRGSYEVIVVADRCNDDTVKIARQFPARIVEKTWKRWKNAYSESLQAGYQEARGTKYLSIVDADVVVPLDFFAKLERRLEGRVASASSDLLVYPWAGAWNAIIYYWQRTYAIAPLGTKPWGACRLLRRDALDEVGGFRDTMTPDSELDQRLAAKGYGSILDTSIRAYHIRRIDLGKIISGQMTSGRGRYRLGESLLHTIGHSILRVRPFVIAGWLIEYLHG